MDRLQPCNFIRQRRVIRIKPLGPAECHLILRRLPAGVVERLAVEGGGRAQFGRCQAGVQRGSRRIAIDVDDRSRKARAEDRGPELRGKVI